MLAKNPGFTLIAVISLALGVGANCAMFSLADALILRPLPVAHSGQVVAVGTKESLEGFGGLFFSYPDLRDLRDHNRSFSDLVGGVFLSAGFTTKPDALPQRRIGQAVTGNFFRALGVEPELGRGFRADEDQVPGRDAVMVLDHSLWEQEFNSDQSILGRKVRLNGIDFTVVGVAPEHFTGTDQFIRFQYYVPMMMWPRLSNSTTNFLEARDLHALTVKGYLNPGVSMSQAQAELTAFSKDLERLYPASNKNREILVRTQFQAKTDEDPINTTLVAMLLTLSGAVLLVACANVASLLTSRGPARYKEMALRLAVGAARARLIRQLVTESLLVGLAGGLVGIGVGYAGIQLFNRIQVPTDMPIMISFGLNPRVLEFSLILAVASVLLFGLVPAFQTSRADLAGAIKTGDPGTAGRPRVWGRSLLVGGQVAAALLLLTISSFLYRAFQKELSGSQGFRRDHLLMMSFDPSLVRYTDQKTTEFYKQLADRARETPGVKSASLTSVTPMNMEGDTISIAPEGFSFPPGKESDDVFDSRVDEAYFDTMAVPILRGRGFRAADDAKAPFVAVVNEQLALHYWPGQDAIGKRIHIRRDGKFVWAEVVGVAKTGKYLWVAEPPIQFLYVPMRQFPRQSMILVAESTGDAAALAAPLREVVRGIDPDQPVFNVRTMEEFYRMRVINSGNVIIETVGGMGMMGVALALVGLYGLGAYAVSRRTREIGIRMAIGANRASVLRMTLRQGVLPALSGLSIGLVGSFFTERLMKSIFPEQTGIDVATYLIVVPATLLVTMLAAYIPAYRASRVDPLVALRYE
jgi:putative ABC transport system permease protein